MPDNNPEPNCKLVEDSGSFYSVYVDSGSRTYYNIGWTDTSGNFNPNNYFCQYTDWHEELCKCSNGERFKNYYTVYWLNTKPKMSLSRFLESTK